MDITTVFGTVILGSNPGRGTNRTGNKRGGHGRLQEFCGYGSVAEWLLAMEQTGVRFSLSALE